MDTHELTYKTERESQRTILWLLGERVEGKGYLGSLGWTYILLYLKWITNKDLLYSTWNPAQCYVPTWMGGGIWGRIDTCIICMASPFALHLKLPQYY